MGTTGAPVARRTRDNAAATPPQPRRRMPPASPPPHATPASTAGCSSQRSPPKLAAPKPPRCPAPVAVGGVPEGTRFWIDWRRLALKPLRLPQRHLEPGGGRRRRRRRSTKGWSARSVPPWLTQGLCSYTGPPSLPALLLPPPLHPLSSLLAPPPRPKVARPPARPRGAALPRRPSLDCQVAAFGAFVRIDGFETDGLVHISQLAERRVESVREEVQDGQRVWVKVLRVEQVKGRPRIGLTMRGINQNTGQEKIFSALLSKGRERD